MAHMIAVRKSSRSRAIGRQSLERLARRIIRAALDGEKMKDAEVGVWFVDDPTIRRLNRRDRGVDRPTDVIAYELSTPRERQEAGVLLGDIVISVTTAHRQARSLGHSLEAELALLLTHGALHLLGCGHERPAQARRMRQKERDYLARCGIRSIQHLTR